MRLVETSYAAAKHSGINRTHFKNAFFQSLSFQAQRQFMRQYAWIFSIDTTPSQVFEKAMMGALAPRQPTLEYSQGTVPDQLDIVINEELRPLTCCPATEKFHIEGIFNNPVKTVRVIMSGRVIGQINRNAPSFLSYHSHGALQQGFFYAIYESGRLIRKFQDTPIKPQKLEIKPMRPSNFTEAELFLMSHANFGQ